MAGSKARTEHGEFTFTVKEAADGTPWIAAEPRRHTMPALKEALIGFSLRRGITLDEAYSVAKFMNENLENISLTLFDTHPMYNDAA